MMTVSFVQLEHFGHPLVRITNAPPGIKVDKLPATTQPTVHDPTGEKSLCRGQASLTVHGLEPETASWLSLFSERYYLR